MNGKYYVIINIEKLFVCFRYDFICVVFYCYEVGLMSCYIYKVLLILVIVLFLIRFIIFK